ncbi:hypothetical protein LN042_21245 [Kitasatospora sp. RB6PN24]|uniref:hypothetical protein n=1 Tax=Kitasatospora humi TaxID=2893891 RepID=UPI001E53653C|nr:hypothetical protein [Kitasatospora humi]MCC9309569.1 hypothetical protein [Kitasatospora humi]
MRTNALLRLALPTAACALLLTACGPDDNSGGTSANSAAPSVATSATPSMGASTGSATTPSAAAGAATPTDNGSGGAGTYQSPLGPTATGHSKGAHKLAITPVSVVKATAADVAPLHFQDSELAGKTPYFVTVQFTNESGATVPDFGDNDMRIWVHTTADDSGIINSSPVVYHIPQCQTPNPAPADNGKGDRECGVYLVPNGQAPEFLSYGAPMDVPMIWKVG